MATVQNISNCLT